MQAVAIVPRAHLQDPLLSWIGMLACFEIQDAQSSHDKGRPTILWPLVHLAVLCSEEAYGATVVSGTGRRSTLERHHVSEQMVHRHGIVVVVALPGTNSIRDWKVNLKGRPCGSRDMLVCGSTLPYTSCMLMQVRDHQTYVTRDF
jgi:hypothetical protein